MSKQKVKLNTLTGGTMVWDDLVAPVETTKNAGLNISQTDEGTSIDLDNSVVSKRDILSDINKLQDSSTLTDTIGTFNQIIGKFSVSPTTAKA